MIYPRTSQECTKTCTMKIEVKYEPILLICMEMDKLPIFKIWCRSFMWRNFFFISVVAEGEISVLQNFKDDFNDKSSDDYKKFSADFSTVVFNSCSLIVIY